MPAEVSIIVKAEDQFSNVLGNFGSIITGIESAINLVSQAFDLAVDTITPFINSASDSEQAIARLDGVLRATGGSVGLTSDQLQSLASGLQNVTRFSDEEVMSAEALMLTFRNVSGDMFPRAITAATDMASIFGSLEASTMQLGKALQDPVAMTGALSRAGVTFTDVQKDMIKEFVETGNVAAAQNIILTEVENQVGGLAEVMGGTFAGQADIFRNKLDEIRETIGGALLPILTDLLTRLSAFLDRPEVIEFFDNLGTSISGFLESLDLGDRLDHFFDTLSTAMETGDWTPVWEEIGNTISAGWTFITPYIDQLFANIFTWMEGKVTAWVNGGGPRRVSNQIIDALDETFQTPEFQGAAATALSSLISTIGDALSLMDWGPIGDALGESFVNTMNNIELTGTAATRAALIRAGDAIVFGIIDGIRWAWGNLINALSFGFDDVIALVMRKLGINSPSTVFFDIGKNIMLGLIGGIESMFGSIVGTIEDLLSTMLGPLQPILDFLGIDLGTGSSTGSHDTGTGGGTTGGGAGTWTGGGGTTGSGDGFGQTVNNYFYGPVYFSGGTDGANYDCPSPNPFLSATSMQMGGL